MRSSLTRICRYKRRYKIGWWDEINKRCKWKGRDGREGSGLDLRIFGFKKKWLGFRKSKWGKRLGRGVVSITGVGSQSGAIAGSSTEVEELYTSTPGAGMKRCA